MALSEQPAPLMNRDTVYSFAVLDGGGDVAITLPQNDGGYMSLHVMNHDHVTYKVFYGPGRFVIPASKSTDFFYANVRMQINDKDPEDVKKVNQYQDALKIEYLNEYKPKPFKVTNWDMKSFEGVRSTYVCQSPEGGQWALWSTLCRWRQKTGALPSPRVCCRIRHVSILQRNRGVQLSPGCQSTGRVGAGIARALIPSIAINRSRPALAPKRSNDGANYWVGVGSANSDYRS